MNPPERVIVSGVGAGAGAGAGAGEGQGEASASASACSNSNSASGTGNRKRKTPEDSGAALMLERKRSISRKSSQRNREKQRSMLDTLQTKQKVFNQKNRAIKKDNERLREHIAAIKRCQAQGLPIPTAEIQAARRTISSDPTSTSKPTSSNSNSNSNSNNTTNGTGTPTATSAAVAAAAATAATTNHVNALLSSAMNAGTSPSAATAATRRALGMSSLLLGAGAGNPDHSLSMQMPIQMSNSLSNSLSNLHVPVGALLQHEQLALLQHLQGSAGASSTSTHHTSLDLHNALPLHHQQRFNMSQAFLPSHARAAAAGSMLGSINPALLHNLANHNENDTTRRLLMQSLLAQHSNPSSATTVGPIDAPNTATASNRARSADPPGNRAANQYNC